MQRLPVCPKCSGAFTPKDLGGRCPRKPLLLTCGHTFCEACLQQQLKERKTSLVCNSCSVETTFKPGEASLKQLCIDRYMIGQLIHSEEIVLRQELNKLTTNMMTAVSQRKRVQSGCSDSSDSEFYVNTDKLCKECEKKQATVHCVNCVSNMCSICFQKVHSMSTSLKKHRSQPVQDGELEVVQMCKFHENRPIEYFCEDDQAIICSRCVIVGTHKGHNISSIEDKNRLIVNEMEPNLQVANQVLRRLKKIDKEIVPLLPDGKKETETALRDVRKHFQHLHGIIQIREQALEREILQVFKTSVEPIEHMRTDLQTQHQNLERAVKSAHRIMNNNDEVIVNAKEILDKLVHAREIPCILELNEDPPATEKISFIPGTSLDDPGSIDGKVSQRFKLWSLAEKPEKFTDDLESLCSNVDTDVDSQSVQSVTTSCSEDVIIEEERMVILDNDDASSTKSTGSNRCSAISKTSKKDKLPAKGRIKGQNKQVEVTHILSPQRFMVQLKSDKGKLASMEYSMQQWCKSPAAAKHRVSGVHVDDIVLAPYSMNKEWYRARIKNVLSHTEGEQIDDVNVEVVYIDYGNTEVVPASRLVNMQSKFMKHPEFSIECCLVNILPKAKDGCWSREAVQTFVKIVENKPMLMIIVREENNVLIVDLCKPPDDEITEDMPVSVRDYLVFMELANLESPSSLPMPGGAPPPKRNYISPDPKDAGETYGIGISYNGTPDCFYVQDRGEEFHYLATMMSHIQDTYMRKMKDGWNILSPQIGLICVARFSSDGNWYRARIVDLPGNREVTVQYVDYGNKETLNVCEIRKIIDSFLILPAQALCCKLIDVEPHNSNDGWTNESLHWWADRVNSATFSLKVIHTGPVLHVVLKNPELDDSVPINVEMVEQGQARSTGKWSESQVIIERPSAMGSHVPRLSYQTGEGLFPEPCELEHQPVYWKSRNARPVRRYQETVLTPPTSPEPTDGAKMMSFPNSPSKQRSPQPRTNQNGLSPQQRTNAEIQVENQEQNNVPTPQSSDSERSSRSHGSGKKSKHSSKKSSKSSKEHFDQEVVVSHFVSPAQFQVQMADAGEKGLDELMRQMHAQYRQSEVAWVSWTKGCYCAVLSPSHGRWYRGVIQVVLQKNLMEVFMLDYGFTEIVSTNNLRSILRQFRHHRCFSFPCHLGGVIPAGGMKEWSKTACELMQDQIRNKKIFIMKKGSVANKSLPIDLIIEDCIEETALEPGRKVYLHLTDLMKERGLAIPLPKKRGEVVHQPKMYPVLYYKKAEAEVKTGDKVMPVYVDYDAVIHCYTMEGDDIFQSMCDTLHQKFKDSDPHGDEQKWEKGQACAAFFGKDSQWHRATLMQMEPNRVQIHFIDYGNSEWVEYDQLRADIEEFIGIPQQTFLCTLHDIKPVTVDKKWTIQALDYLHKQIVNKYCIVTVIEKNGFENEYMTVNLDLEGQDIASHLVHYGIAERGEYITDQEAQCKQIETVLLSQKSFKMMPSIPVEETIAVIVTHVELPNIVYLQHIPIEITDELPEQQKKQQIVINDCLQKLEKLSLDMNKAAPGLPSVPTPQIGLQCCAQFTYDMCWYRALIVDTYPDTKQYLVLFVDYGNSEVLTIQKIRALPPKYHSLPCQAIRAQLAHLQPPSTVVSWTKTSLLEMMKAVANKSLQAHVVKNKPFTVELHEQTDGGVAEDLVYKSVIDSGSVIYLPPSLDTPPPSVEPKFPASEVKEEEDCENSHVKETVAPSDLEVTDVKVSESSTSAITTEECKSSKSWVEMADEGSSVDISELPKFDDDDDNTNSTPVVESEVTEDQIKDAENQTKDDTSGSKKRKAKLESIVNDDECFD